MIITDQSPRLTAEVPESVLCIPRHIALIDGEGNIVSVHKDWIAFAKEHGAVLKNVGSGVNYFELFRRACSSPATSRRVAAGIHEVLKGKSETFVMDYRCRATGLAHFRMTATPIDYGAARAAIAHTDISDLQMSKENDFNRLQDFARRLITAQEKERRRIAGEIHDDVGNRLALMSLSLRRFLQQAAKTGDSTFHDLNSVLDGITELSNVLRNISHGLHPASLRYLGIRAALTSLVEGFKRTHDIHVDTVIPPALPRLPHEVELCIFRITQECLHNIIKHSGASQVRIVLAHPPKYIRLTVSDNGKGLVFSEAIQKDGLGLRSMEERALSIGGRLTVNSSPQSGTQVRLAIPLEFKAE
jgi:signal transduction histidine kinase